MDNNSNFALAEALQQAGVKLKAALFATGYQPDVIHSPAWSALQGDYFYSLFRPWSLPDAATKQMQTAMEKYDGYSKTDFPSFSEYEAWLGADLMIKGLQLAGPNPTHASVIKALRGVKSYNANGLLPVTLNFSTDFGHDSKSCAWMVRANEDRLYAGLVAALLWHGHPRDIDRQRHFIGSSGLRAGSGAPARGATGPSSLGSRSQACRS